MFERWRQILGYREKSSCSMRSSITRLSQGVRAETIPNPERRALDKEIRAARAQHRQARTRIRCRRRGQCRTARPTMRGFKIAHGRLGKQLRTARARVAQLFEQRRDVAKRVEVRDLNERAVVKLATERKRLTDIIKMVPIEPRAICLRCCDLTTPVPIKKGEPCCTSCSLLQANIPRLQQRAAYHLGSAQLAASHARRPGSLRDARPNGDTLPGSAYSGFASHCVRHRVSGLPSLARRSSAAPQRPSRRSPDRRENRSSFHYAMSGGLNLSGRHAGAGRASRSCRRDWWRDADPQAHARPPMSGCASAGCVSSNSAARSCSAMSCPARPLFADALALAARRGRARNSFAGEPQGGDRSSRRLASPGFRRCWLGDRSARYRQVSQPAHRP